MEKLNAIIAKNISSLRTKNKMTQNDLAERLNYTDKSVSKWEHGDSVPPIETLKEIGCDYIQGYVWGRPMSADDALEFVFS